MGRTAVALAMLLAAPSGAAVAGSPSLDRAVERLFQPYSLSPERPTPPVWERPIWSHDTAALIARWRKVTPRDEVDDLSDGDWICQCQDWDEHAFKLAIQSRRFDGQSGATVNVRFRLDRCDWRSEQLSMRLEGGAWKVDDLVGEGFRGGLKAQIVHTIAEDRHH